MSEVKYLAKRLRNVVRFIKDEEIQSDVVLGFIIYERSLQSPQDLFYPVAAKDKPLKVYLSFEQATEEVIKRIRPGWEQKDFLIRAIHRDIATKIAEIPRYIKESSLVVA